MKINSRIFLFILIAISLISCGPSEEQQIQGAKCESLFENLYEQEKFSYDSLFNVEVHMSSLVMEVSISENIEKSGCYDLLQDVNFATYGFGGLDSESLYRSRICELGYNLAWYRDYSNGREADDLLIPEIHCPLGESFYQDVRN